MASTGLPSYVFGGTLRLWDSVLPMDFPSGTSGPLIGTTGSSEGPSGLWSCNSPGVLDSALFDLIGLAKAPVRLTAY